MLRLLTPGQFAICAVLFFLPWVEIECRAPELGALKDTNTNAEAPKPKPGGWIPLFSQSGLEAAKGDYTVLDSSMRAMIELGKRDGAEEAPDEEVKPAPILFGYLGAVASGAILGLLLPAGWFRKAILLFLCAVALGAVGWQTAEGLPLVKTARDAIQKKDRERAQDGAPAMKADEIIKVKYKIAYYLAFAFAATAGISALLEPGAKRKGKSVDQTPPASTEPPPETPGQPEELT